MARVNAVDGNVHDRADAAAGFVIYAEALHQAVVAGGYRSAVYLCDNAVAAYLLDIAHSAAVKLPAVSLAQAFADRVRGGALGKGRVFKQLSSSMGQ